MYFWGLKVWGAGCGRTEAAGTFDKPGMRVVGKAHPNGGLFCFD